jgi:integral membrane protein
MGKTNLGLLRIIGLLEGISYLLLLGIAMPLKYLFKIPAFIYPVGMAHGILFTLFVIFVFIVAFQLKWSLKIIFLALISSLLPLGTFIADRKIFSKI